MESSYHFHITRKSMKISYMCRHCGKLKVFYNRCNFLAHIRSHSFKTATINVTDIKVEPLPINYFNMKALQKSKEATEYLQKVVQEKQKFVKIICMECKKDITITGTAEDRVKHYMEVTDVNTVHSCPVCLCALPTACALKTHLRIHLKCAPFACPECGMHLSNKSISYPYHNHNCEGFKMMRATTRLQCRMPDCYVVHPNEFKNHILQNHLHKIFKCPCCYVGCSDLTILQRHMVRHEIAEKSITLTNEDAFYRCKMCNDSLVMPNQVESHLELHMHTENIYPCWACGKFFKDVPSLIEHHMNSHGANEVLKNVFDALWKNRQTQNAKAKRLYRVVKLCEKCKRCFKYDCKFDQIRKLPNVCPYQCTKDDSKDNTQIICQWCKQNVYGWDSIKKHYATHHPTHRCLELSLRIQKLNDKTVQKYLDKQNIKLNDKKASKSNMKDVESGNKKDKIDNEYSIVSVNESSKEKYKCSKCAEDFADKELLETHLIIHRDPCIAYQCMECGQCFVVKPTFSKHLLLEHGITDVEDYIINKKQCYNESALSVYQHDSVDNEQLKENQCKICREQFDHPSELEKHFRVHGMAFLMKTKSNSP